MLKLNKKYLKTLLLSVATSLFFIQGAVVYAVAPPLQPGCYTKSGDVYTETNSCVPSDNTICLLVPSNTPIDCSTGEISSAGGSGSADKAKQVDVDGYGNQIFGLISTVLDLIFAVTGFIVIGMIIVGGIQYSTAGGNPQATSKAKEKITNAITALLLIVFLYPFLLWLIPGGGGIFQ